MSGLGLALYALGCYVGGMVTLVLVGYLVILRRRRNWAVRSVRQRYERGEVSGADVREGRARSGVGLADARRSGSSGIRGGGELA